MSPPGPGAEHRVGEIGAVVVNHNAGPALRECLASLRAEGVEQLVVLDNASGDGSCEEAEVGDPDLVVVALDANVGYGSGVNRALAWCATEMVLVANPDVVVHDGALDALAAVLASDPTLAVAGPRILEPNGTRYRSARRFPSLLDAAGHALLSVWTPHNRFSRRYRMDELDAATDPVEVDWVSGACFLARRDALDELGGFDESYFMYAEDLDLCWRARRAGWGVAYVPGARVTHLQGVSTSRRPWRMLLEHHRSALRFAWHSTRGVRRLVLVPTALVLGARLVLAAAQQALRSGGYRGRGAPGRAGQRRGPVTGERT